MLFADPTSTQADSAARNCPSYGLGQTFFLVPVRLFVGPVAVDALRESGTAACRDRRDELAEARALGKPFAAGLIGQRAFLTTANLLHSAILQPAAWIPGTS